MPPLSYFFFNFLTTPVGPRRWQEGGCLASRRQKSTPKPFGAQTENAASAYARCHP